MLGAAFAGREALGTSRRQSTALTSLPFRVIFCASRKMRGPYLVTSSLKASGSRLLAASTSAASGSCEFKATARFALSVLTSFITTDIRCLRHVCAIQSLSSSGVDGHFSAFFKHLVSFHTRE